MHLFHVPVESGSCIPSVQQVGHGIVGEEHEFAVTDGVYDVVPRVKGEPSEDLVNIVNARIK